MDVVNFDIRLVNYPGRGSSAIEALARHVTDSMANLSSGLMAAE